MDFLEPSGKRKRELDLTPLINIIFLILIFFMLTAAIAPNEDTLISPVASDVEAAITNSDDVVVTIDAAAAVFLDGQQIPKSQLEKALADIARVEPSSQLAIKADSALDANVLIELMVLAKEVGIESVALMTIRR